MTAIDRDQVLQNLETLHDSQAKSHDMALWRDGVWQAILEVRAIAALPAIPLDDEIAKNALTREAELTRRINAARDELERPLAYVYGMDAVLDAMIDRKDATLKILAGALPVLETKKETE